ncbi:unnamed protein product [Adineta steineri]|uniref:Peptide deformylase n=1 Tax=Adineta steineri TaxID=433720 RepID=A0A815FCK4_9BILA|nr:unnamed protein product [Adineta steineri]CAF1324711.1 unnamed protein product [Adineta steineri]CAF1559129.1 unnamed protein product [Adineta steineri]CAF1586489.1 unnamed protein product [Adineta steineri]
MSLESHSQQAKEHVKDIIPQLLQLVAETDPILHSPIEEMSLTDISSDATKQIVANMVYSIRPQQLQRANAPYSKAAGMAANQWNINKRIFLFCPTGSDGEIKVIFNPTYKPITLSQDSINALEAVTSDPTTDFCREGCFSVLYAYGMVERYMDIDISYVDDKGMQHLNEKLSGWQARVWQHETDHLNGILYSNKQSGISKGPNCTELHRFQNKDEFEKNYPK